MVASGCGGDGRMWRLVASSCSSAMALMGGWGCWGTPFWLCQVAATMVPPEEPGWTLGPTLGPTLGAPAPRGGAELWVPTVPPARVGLSCPGGSRALGLCHLLIRRWGHRGTHLPRSGATLCPRGVPPSLGRSGQGVAALGVRVEEPTNPLHPPAGSRSSSTRRTKGSTCCWSTSPSPSALSRTSPPGAPSPGPPSTSPGTRGAAGSPGVPSPHHGTDGALHWGGAEHPQHPQPQ